MRHKRWGSMIGDLFEYGGKYAHPYNAGKEGSSLSEDMRMVMHEGRSDFNRIALKAIPHPISNNYKFLLTHGVQTDKFVRVLRCNDGSGSRICATNRYTSTNPLGYGEIPPNAELVFGTFPEAQPGGYYEFDGGLQVTSAADMDKAIEAIGFELVYNDATRGWEFEDDDGSFLLKHASLNMIAVPLHGGTEQSPITNGIQLVWKNCPTNCKDDYTRDDFSTLGFVFEAENGLVCLPAGV